MRPALARSVKAGLRAMGHYARRLGRDRFPGVAVLCYHGVRADDSPPGAMPFEGLHVRAGELDAHCRLLREHCHPIGLDEWRRALTGRLRLPERPVLLTFDDGYRSVLTLARPILERHAIPAAVFVCSDPPERQRLFWYDAVARERGAAEVDRLKRLPFAEWQRAAALAAVPWGASDPSAPLGIAEIAALAALPGVEIGGHTAGHPVLARADRDQQLDQIRRNKRALEAWTRRPVSAFAYPDGRPGRDYTPETVRLVAESGFDFAFTTRAGFAGPGEPPLERSRFVMLAGISAAELAHRLAYSWPRRAAGA